MSKNEFRENLKKWIKLQEKQNKYQKYINLIKNKKNTIQPNLINYMNKNNIDNTSINKNFELKLNKVNRYSFLSKSYIQQILKKHIKNEKLIEVIIDDLYSSREVKIDFNLNINKLSLKC